MLFNEIDSEEKWTDGVSWNISEVSRSVIEFIFSSVIKTAVGSSILYLSMLKRANPEGDENDDEIPGSRYTYETVSFLVVVVICISALSIFFCTDGILSDTFIKLKSQYLLLTL